MFAYSISEAKLCIAMKNPTPSVDEIVHKNIGPNPMSFALDKINTPYLYKVYNYRKSFQPKQRYRIDDTTPPVKSLLHHYVCNCDIHDCLGRVPLETDQTVSLHLLHSEALQKLANQLPVVKLTNTSRIHRMDLLLVDLCLVSKMISREFKLQYVCVYLYLINYITCY